jgi:hypothetical protein
MMWELFMFGSFGFWMLVTIVTIILLYCAENDRGALATLTVIATLCLLNWCGQIPVFAYIWDHPLVVIPGIAAYFLLGTIWGVGKWFFYVKDQREKYDALKLNFIKKENLTISVDEPIPDDLKALWQTTVQGYYEDGRYHSLDVNPKVGRHKMRIYIWIAYWPWSLVWTMINDPVRKIFNRIYKSISGYLQSISDRYFKDTDKDFKKESNQ